MSYIRLPIKNEKEKELKILKENLEKIGIRNPTYDEIMEILLEKNKRLVINEKDIKEIIKKSRGIL